MGGNFPRAPKCCLILCSLQGLCVAQSAAISMANMQNALYVAAVGMRHHFPVLCVWCLCPFLHVSMLNSITGGVLAGSGSVRNVPAATRFRGAFHS